VRHELNSILLEWVVVVYSIFIIKGDSYVSKSKCTTKDIGWSGDEGQ